MLVILRESGGFANVLRSCSVDTDTLPRAIATQLEHDCCAVMLAPPGAPGTAARDARTLTLEVVGDEGGRRTTSFIETSAPAELRSVFAVLRPYCRIIPAVRI